FSALRGCELRDAIPALGSFHDAAQRGDIEQGAGDDFVGGDHEVFDEIGGRILLFFYNVDDLVVQHDGTDFDGLDVQGAVQIALLLQCLRHTVLQFQLGLQVGRSGHLRRRRSGSFEPGSDRVVGELGFVTNNRAIEVAGFDVPVTADYVLGDDGECVLVLEQGRDAGGEHLGQHGEGAHAGVDSGGFFGGVLVDGAVFADQSVHIGDTD